MIVSDSGGSFTRSIDVSALASPGVGSMIVARNFLDHDDANGIGASVTLSY